MKIFLTALIALIGMMNVACAAEIVDREPARNLSTSVNEFCWKYFATLDHSFNCLYSPYGINVALSILANGATGDTRTEILNVLAVDNVENLNDAHKNFLATVEKNYRGENLFGVANAFLVDKRISGRGLNKDFQRTVTDVYKADVRTADFAGNIDGERKKIARFVAEKTNGFIPEYNSLASTGTLTDLFNVVSFKCDWKFPFDKRFTERDDFTNCDGTKFQIEMMSKTFDEKISYLADEKFCGIQLPYSTGAAMYLILPVDENALNVSELWINESTTYRENFLDALKKSPPFDGKVVVRMPNVAMEFDNSLIECFWKLGIKKALTDNAEFFNVVNDTQLKIDNAIHHAKIDIDEKGTTAAAVTEITMLETTAMPGPPRIVHFNANRPFVFVIRDVKSNVTLFAGAMNHF